MKALPPIPEGALVCCVGAPEVIARSLTFGEIVLELMRLRPRTGHSGDLDVFLKRRVEGILEAWSSRALAFDRDCTETLQKLADFSGRVTRPGRGFEEGSRPTL